MAVLIGISAILALSRSRGGFIGLLAVGLALMFMLTTVPIAKRLGFVGALVVALLVVAPGDYWETIQTLQDPTADYNWSDTYGRKKVWERGIGYMLERPLTGLGIGNFPRAEATISDVAVNFVDRIGVSLRWGAAHNSFVQAGAELGIPGLVLFCLLVFGGIVGVTRLRRRLPRAWARGDPEQRFVYYATVYLPVAFVAFASTAFFLSFAWRDPIYLIGAYVAGLYTAVNVARRRPYAAAGLGPTPPEPRQPSLPGRVRYAAPRYRSTTQFD